MTQIAVAVMPIAEVEAWQAFADETAATPTARSSGAAG
jgi:hypothetical protein